MGQHVVCLLMQGVGAGARHLQDDGGFEFRAIIMPQAAEGRQRQEGKAIALE